jgi:alkanesulfonate monooxygenase SsuD/methylene tetrahydromethanopterin reductase-like flavin-dependent oxidoreductase (luciferase family)
LGLGRGSFFDFLNLNDKDKFTRKGFEETHQLVSHFFQQKQEEFKGKIFKTTAKAVLRVPSPANPYFVTATWNTKMAYLGGKYSNEVQLAEVFTETYLDEMLKSFQKGCFESKINGDKHLSIGGMICVSDDSSQAVEKAKRTLAVYIPYLKTILKQHKVDVKSKLIKEIDFLSKNGNNIEASSLIPDDFVSILTLSGTPDDVSHKLKKLIKGKPIKGIMFSPPYSTFDSMEENILYLAQKLLPKLQ